MRNWRKEGQTTIFIIVAIVIVAGAVLIYFFYPEIKSFVGGEVAPNTYLKTCVEPGVRDGVEMLASQGGSPNPQSYVLHGGNKVKYLCYTSQYYLTCQIQEPFIQKNFEEELNKIVKAKTDVCVEKLKAEYGRRGFAVSAEEAATGVEIIPGVIRVNIDAPISVSKDDTTQSFEEFDIEIPSEMFNLFLIASSVIDYEATYGDTDTSIYLMYYPNLDIDKTVLSDGTTVYSVGDVTTGERFTFASRSLAWPAGYGLKT